MHVASKLTRIVTLYYMLQVPPVTRGFAVPIYGDVGIVQLSNVVLTLPLRSSCPRNRRRQKKFLQHLQEHFPSEGQQQRQARPLRNSKRSLRRFAEHSEARNRGRGRARAQILQICL